MNLFDQLTLATFILGAFVPLALLTTCMFLGVKLGMHIRAGRSIKRALIVLGVAFTAYCFSIYTLGQLKVVKAQAAQAHALSIEAVRVANTAEALCGLNRDGAPPARPKANRLRL